MNEEPENNQQPKCLRIVVTAFFADGSSSVIDIPEPAEVKDESRVIEPEEIPMHLDPVSFASRGQYEFVLRARVNPDIPIRLLVLPIPEEEDPGKLRLERQQWLRDQDKNGR